MAKRPVFSPDLSAPPYVKETYVEFKWYPGFAKSQAQKSIDSLHKAAGKQGISPVLEISSKSSTALGVALSAFNLLLEVQDQHPMSVECAFQGSKVFEKGGPFHDLYSVSSREAKTDGRLRSSGNLVAFDFLGESFPISPMTAFYDWLYIAALWQNIELAEMILAFQGFSDIAFNPKRSINCQAHSAALFVALHHHGIVEHIVQDKDYFFHLMSRGSSQALAAETAHQPNLL